jgi:hypothetical protein
LLDKRTSSPLGHEGELISRQRECEAEAQGKSPHLADTGDRWQINLIGHNITDERYIQAGFADEAVQSV